MGAIFSSFPLNGVPNMALRLPWRPDSWGRIRYRCDGEAALFLRVAALLALCGIFILVDSRGQLQLDQRVAGSGSAILFNAKNMLVMP